MTHPSDDVVTPADGRPDEEPVDDPKGPWRGIILRLLLTIVVLGGAYAVLAHVVGGRIPSGTSVGGVEIGGLSESQARAKVEKSIAQRTDGPFTLTPTEGDPFEIDPHQAGLSVDVDRSLAGLVGVSYAPGDVWRRLTGGSDRDLVATVDDARLAAALEKAGSGLSRKPTSGDVKFVYGSVEVEKATTGRALDVDGAAKAVRAVWPMRSEAEAPVVETEPDITQKEVDDFVESFADPAMSGPVTLMAGGTPFTLTNEQVSEVLSADAVDGRLQPALDVEGLVDRVRAAAPGAETAPVNATVSLASGKPVVKKGRPGKVIAEKGLEDALLEALQGEGGARTVKIALEEKDPELTGEGWRMDQKIGDFTTPLPVGQQYENRTFNIGVGAGKLDGTIVYPGERFSLLRLIGDVGDSPEYKDAGVINAGRLEDSRGGGLSQVSTTMFNAAWFAGVELNEWLHHQYYISRYPEGREATIWYPDVDNIWTNTTDSPIIMHAKVSPEKDALRVWFMGEKTFTVESSTSKRRDLVEPKNIEDDSEKCKTMHPTDGFTVTIKRVVKKDGKVVDRLSRDVTYIPEDEVTCTNPLADPE